ncbi:Holliday junction resolvase RuvX [Christensenella intestinihominis]|uniref:Holliday junction resolvase RuvX n=1 Tax=Christensenella intestinihominis TaxID=1851429 RepID=UPI00082FD7D8|nr:Holliday junction resolvase RuvX [Christensenella intestinihominis]
MGRVLGLDVGDIRIGVALSDLLMITAQGIETYTRKDEEADIRYFCDLMDKQDVDTLVVGLPKNMNGTIGEQAEKVQDFAGKLKAACGRKLIYWDERLTTKSAHRTLLEADMSRKKRKAVVDKIAAVYILQGYMDSL